MIKAVAVFLKRFTFFAVSLLSTFSAAEEVEYIVTPDSAPLGLPFSDAVIVNDLLIMSGQLGVNPKDFSLVTGGIEAETKQIFSNMSSLLESKGAALDDIVKCTVMIADINEWPAFNTIYLSYFKGNKPARSALGANGLALNAAVELECWARLDD